ncbi:hypothetical protein EAF00_009833 [Botryotinia globosa]|nr:hypothetical protein EAF00_009833 [Botryotinia globosa]
MGYTEFKEPDIQLPLTGDLTLQGSVTLKLKNTSFTKFWYGLFRMFRESPNSESIYLGLMDDAVTDTAQPQVHDLVIDTTVSNRYHMLSPESRPIINQRRGWIV